MSWSNAVGRGNCRPDLNNYGFSTVQYVPWCFLNSFPRPFPGNLDCLGLPIFSRFLPFAWEIFSCSSPSRKIWSLRILQRPLTCLSSTFCFGIIPGFFIHTHCLGAWLHQGQHSKCENKPYHQKKQGLYMFCRPWHLSALIMMSIHPRITTGWPCIRVYEFLSFISWPFGYCYCFVHLDCIFLSRVLDTPEVEIRARFCFVYFLYKSIPRTHILSRRICLCHPGREERRTTSHAIFLFAACYLLSSMENSD